MCILDYVRAKRQKTSRNGTRRRRARHAAAAGGAVVVHTHDVPLLRFRLLHFFPPCLLVSAWLAPLYSVGTLGLSTTTIQWRPEREREKALKTYMTRTCRGTQRAAIFSPGFCCFCFCGQRRSNNTPISRDVCVLLLKVFGGRVQQQQNRVFGLVLLLSLICSSAR